MIINTFSSVPAFSSASINSDLTAAAANQPGDFAALMLFALALPQNSIGIVNSNGAQATPDNAPLALLGEREMPLQTATGQLDAPNEIDPLLDQPSKASSSLSNDELAILLIAGALISMAHDVQLNPNTSANVTEGSGESKSATEIPEKDIASASPTTVSTMPVGLLDNQPAFDAADVVEPAPESDNAIGTPANMRPDVIAPLTKLKIDAGAPISGEANKPVSSPQQKLDFRLRQGDPLFDVTTVASDEKIDGVAARSTDTSLAQTTVESAEGFEAQPTKQAPSAGQDLQKAQATGNGTAIARGQEYRPETNLGPVISALARERTNETSPGLKLGQQSHAPGDRGVEMSVGPVQAAHEGNLSALVNDRQRSANDRGDAETKNPDSENQWFTTMFTADPTAPRQETRSHADLSPSAWRPTVERLAGDMISRMRIGLRDAVIQLDPPELGSIKIDLHMEGAKLQAKIVTEAHEAQSLIENHLTELRQALQTRGIDVGDVRVSHGGWSGTSGDFTQSFHQTPQGRQESGWRFENSAGAARDKSDVVTTQAAALDHSRVSIRV